MKLYTLSCLQGRQPSRRAPGLHGQQLKVYMNFAYDRALCILCSNHSCQFEQLRQGPPSSLNFHTAVTQNLVQVCQKTASPGQHQGHSCSLATLDPVTTSIMAVLLF